MFSNEKTALRATTYLACTALGLGVLLSGCAKQEQVPKPSTATVQTHAFTIVQAQSDTYLLDTVEGKVWRLERSPEGVHFVPVDVTAVRGVGTGTSAEQCAKAQTEFAKYGGVALCTLGASSDQDQGATKKQPK